MFVTLVCCSYYIRFYCYSYLSWVKKHQTFNLTVDIKEETNCFIINFY